MKGFWYSFGIWAVLCAGTAQGQSLPVISGVEAQPLVAQAVRLDEALTFLGSALQDETTASIQALAQAAPSEDVVKGIQEVLDPYCLAMVSISPEGRVKTQPGPAEPRLMQDGWTTFLIKVHNEASIRSELVPDSPNSEPVSFASSGRSRPMEDNLLSPGQVAQRFLELNLYRRPPMMGNLSGLEVEYVILQAYTRETGKREAQIGFHVGEGSQDIGFRNAVPVLFDISPSVKVKLDVKDFDGEPTMAGFIIMDGKERIAEAGKDFADDYHHRRAQVRPWEGSAKDARRLQGIYPLPARRVAMTDEYPDFYFHPQVYRADGEHVYLPPGTYTVYTTRGPEYVPQERDITVPAGVEEHTESFSLERWIHMADKGWYSGDHHVHGGGCSHYESPEAGVNPYAMFRQALGEDLNVSCVLSWGPCWYHQKTFFEGDIHELSTETNVMRYDVEVSGFPSQHAGHLCLLRLKEDDYPGTELIEEWPSWTLPILQWGQQQGGIVGYSHSGWGLEPMEPTEELPNYVMAKFDGIGANEYVVTATHGACDFISAGDTPVTWEMNVWYHTLNCGIQTRISGETDFPCIYDERVGMARSYVPLGEKLDFDAFAEQLKLGSNYVSDGLSHIYDFRAADVTMGKDGSLLKLDQPGSVRFVADVAAYLPEVQTDEGVAVQNANINRPPYWHLEKARIDDTRTVKVELVVDGYPVDEQVITADGSVNEVAFDHAMDHSGWAAIRILPSSHTNPIFIEIDDKPVRSSKRSAEWCRAAVDRCWEMKEPGIREEERGAAREAYDFARKYYDQAIAESTKD